MKIDVSAIKSIFNPKLRPLVGVDISSTSVKMVELVDSGKGQPRVERYAIEPLPADSVVDGDFAAIDAIAETIQKCWKRLGTSTRNIAMALPTAAVITKKIILPGNLREEEMEVQVESEANQYIPFALEEVNLDFQVIGPLATNPEDVEVMLAASRKEKVEDRMAVAELADLKVVVMDVESYATQAAYEMVIKQLPGGGKDQIVALVDVGAAAMKVTVSKNEETLYAREQAFGGAQLTEEIMRAYGMSHDEAENLKRSGTPPDNYEAEVLHPFLESMSLEIARALQFFFTSTPFSEVHHILLAGGATLLPRIEEIVSARTKVNTLLADPFAGMALASSIRAKQLAADAPSLLVACGLALRKFD